MTTPTVFIDGIALWAPTLPGWDIARAALRGEGLPADPPARRPAPELLPPAERRRAPDTVALALEVAAHAVAHSGWRAGELLSVFTSCHGDLAITDAMCRTLVSAPTLISPTKFHNSVHNAASGYWGIANGCMQPSIAVSAFECSFAAGLLEALTQCAADARPVLLVGCDIAACGALASTNDSRGLLAAALVVAPNRSDRSLAALEWSLASGAAARIPLRSPAALPLATNAMADALPLFEALACGTATPLAMPLSARLALRLQLHALA
ncbi:MAG TPA: beta-ketoacyl synthase chain length factor [Burkholderiaceae bacterium]